MKIVLTKGKIALIDDIDADLKNHAWQAYNDASKNLDHWYARRGEYVNGKPQGKETSPSPFD